MPSFGNPRAQWVQQPSTRRIRAQIISGPEVKGRAQRTQERVYQRAIRTAPKRSGNLARKHRKLPLRVTPNGYVGEVENTARYANIVHEGRGPIVPRRARALRFRIRGRLVFARRVGPAKAQPWLRNAMVWAAKRDGFRVIG